MKIGWVRDDESALQELSLPERFLNANSNDLALSDDTFYKINIHQQKKIYNYIFSTKDPLSSSSKVTLSAIGFYVFSLIYASPKTMSKSAIYIFLNLFLYIFHVTISSELS